jgi:hypothetical protein
MTRTDLPEPIFSPRLTVLPEGSTTDSAASAGAVTVLPFTVATRLDVVGSTSHSQSGEAAAMTVCEAAARRRCCCFAVPRRSGDAAGACCFRGEGEREGVGGWVGWGAVSFCVKHKKMGRSFQRRVRARRAAGKTRHCTGI